MASHEYIDGTGWQSPKQFESLGGGECVGFAVDLVYHLGSDAKFIVANMSWDHDGHTHAIVEYKGRYIEPQINGFYYELGDGELISIQISYIYYEIMDHVTGMGTKSILPSL